MPANDIPQTMPEVIDALDTATARLQEASAAGHALAEESEIGPQTEDIYKITTRLRQVARNLDRLAEPQRPQITVKVYYSHAGCGHRTHIHDAVVNTWKKDQQAGDVVENAIEGKKLCEECYDRGLTDGSVAPLTSTQWKAIKLYRSFSETCYAASWMSNPEQHREHFIQYLKNEMAALQSNEQPEAFELDAVELLTNCTAEAGYPATGIHQDAYSTTLAMEEAALAISKVAREERRSFAADREAVE